MALARPTLQTLIDRIATDIEARLPGADARTRRSNLAVLARVQAGAVHGLYGYLADIALQVMVDTADGDGLDRHANIWGVARKPADPARGNITVTGTSGTTVPAGTELVRADGTVYTTDALATLNAGTATVAVTAAQGSAAGNTEAATVLTFVSPIAGVNGQATVATGGLTGGTDVEGDDALRGRILDRIQKPPHGGNADDYMAWAKEVPGVTRAWCTPNGLGVGTVVVRFTRDDDPSIIPDAGEVQAVQDHIDPLRPVTASVTVVAPIAVAMNFTISVSPDTQAVRNAVTAQLTDLLRREAEPGGVILLSHIREAISVAAGENNHTLTAPSADVTHGTGEIAVMGVITWV